MSDEPTRPFAVLAKNAAAAREILATLTEDSIRNDPETRKMVLNVIRGERLIFAAIDEWLRDLHRKQTGDGTKKVA